MKDEKEFFNLYNHGLIRVAVGVPEVRVADPAFNGARTLELMEKAEGEKALLALFPELGLTAYSCEDLFQQQALLDGSIEALRGLLKGIRGFKLNFSGRHAATSRSPAVQLCCSPQPRADSGSYSQDFLAQLP